MLHCGYDVPLVMHSVVFVPNIPFRIMTKKFNLGFKVFLTTLPHSPDIWRIWEIVVTYTTQPVLARNSCSSFNVAVGLLAASLTSFLLTFSSVLEGRPVLGNITVELYFLHLMLTVFTVFHGLSNALKMILYPSPDCWKLSVDLGPYS